jgi:hypothetical protein
MRFRTPEPILSLYVGTGSSGGCARRRSGRDTRSTSPSSTLICAQWWTCASVAPSSTSLIRTTALSNPARSGDRDASDRRAGPRGPPPRHHGSGGWTSAWGAPRRAAPPTRPRPRASARGSRDRPWEATPTRLRSRPSHWGAPRREAAPARSRSLKGAARDGKGGVGDGERKIDEQVRCVMGGKGG